MYQQSRFFNRSRQSACALLALAALLPTASGCTKDERWAPNPSSATPGVEQPSGVETDPLTQEVTGQTHYSVDDDGTRVIVQGYRADGSEASRVTFSGGGSVINVLLHDPGLPDSSMALTLDPIAPGATGMTFETSVDGTSAAVLSVDAEGNVSGDESAFAGHSRADLGSLFLMLDYTQNTTGFRSRWWACAGCAVGVAAVAAGIYLLIQIGIGPGLIPAIVRAWKFGGREAVLAVLRKIGQNLTEAQWKILEKGCAALMALGAAALGACIYCVTGEKAAAAAN
jgi:hypothetical protein